MAEAQGQGEEKSEPAIIRIKNQTAIFPSILGGTHEEFNLNTYHPFLDFLVLFFCLGYDDLGHVKGRRDTYVNLNLMDFVHY